MGHYRGTSDSITVYCAMKSSQEYIDNAWNACATAQEYLQDCGDEWYTTNPADALRNLVKAQKCVLRALRQITKAIGAIYYEALSQAHRDLEGKDNVTDTKATTKHKCVH